MFGMQSLKDGLSAQERMKLFESFWSKQDEQVEPGLQSKTIVLKIQMVILYITACLCFVISLIT